MFWRPVPSFEPSPEAFAPSIEMVNLQKAAIADAIAAGQLGPAEVDQVVHLVSVFIVGVLSQAIANEPDLEWGYGRFTPLFPQLMALLPALYPPHLDRTGPTAADLLDPLTKPVTRTAPKDASLNLFSRRHRLQPTGARRDAQNTQTEHRWFRRFACDRRIRVRSGDQCRLGEPPGGRGPRVVLHASHLATSRFGWWRSLRCWW